MYSIEIEVHLLADSTEYLLIYCVFSIKQFWVMPLEFEESILNVQECIKSLIQDPFDSSYNDTE